MRRTLMVGVAFGMLLAACGDDAHDEPRLVPLTADDGGTIIEVAVGDELQVDLEGNPSTGYTWVNESPASTAVVEVGEPEFIAESELIGAPGVMRCRFEAVESGTAQIELAYRRPWEEDVDPERVFSITVTVK